MQRVRTAAETRRLKLFVLLEINAHENVQAFVMSACTLCESETEIIDLPSCTNCRIISLYFFWTALLFFTSIAVLISLQDCTLQSHHNLLTSFSSSKMCWLLTSNTDPFPFMCFCGWKKSKENLVFKRLCNVCRTSVVKYYMTNCLPSFCSYICVFIGCRFSLETGRVTRANTPPVGALQMYSVFFLQTSFC